MSKIKTVEQNGSRSEQISNFSKKPQMNAKEKSVYSLVALPISQLSEINDQNIFILDNGDGSIQCQSSTGSPVENSSMINLAASFNGMNMDQSYNSSVYFYHTNRIVGKKPL